MFFIIFLRQIKRRLGFKVYSFENMKKNILHNISDCDRIFVSGNVCSIHISINHPFANRRWRTDAIIFLNLFYKKKIFNICNYKKIQRTYISLVKVEYYRRG